jgi:hypothetical protein
MIFEKERRIRKLEQQQRVLMLKILELEKFIQDHHNRLSSIEMTEYQQ